MKQSKLQGTATERILQTAKIVLCGILCLLFVILAVLEGVSGARAEGLHVTEVITVSSAPIDKANSRWSTELNGIIASGEDGVKIDNITVTVSGERGRERFELDGFVLLPRSTEQIFYTTETPVAFDRVRSVEVCVDGQIHAIDNTVALGGAGGVLAFGALAIVFALLGVHAAKVRYYMWQETKKPEIL